jgi:hypothetical protein
LFNYLFWFSKFYFKWFNLKWRSIILDFLGNDIIEMRGTKIKKALNMGCMLECFLKIHQGP